jgi:hypothetical protein
MLVALAAALLQDRITLPPKPINIRGADYNQVLRYAQLGEKGEIAWSLVGLKAMIHDQGVTLGTVQSKGDLQQLADFDLALRGASRIWNQKLGQRIFEVNNSNPAIRIKLVGHLPNQSACLGCMNYKRVIRSSANGPIYTLDGTIDVVRTHQGRYLSRLELQEVLTHELGHLLGLEDSATPGIMAEFDALKLAFEPSVTEIESLAIYRGIVRAVIERVSNLKRGQ